MRVMHFVVSLVLLLVVVLAILLLVGSLPNLGEFIQDLIGNGG